MLSVAAAMIVRDEERFLPGCLDSLHGKVDEIILVDTGSKDRTVAIAEQFGARIFHFPWTDDFAAARNRGLDEVAAEWVLYIDADERLHTPADRPVAHFIAAEAIGAFVHFQPKTGYTCYRELRLFRRDPRVRFSGVIHETMVPAIERIVCDEQAFIATTPVRLEHLGYDGDPLAKAARNMPLLRRAISDGPNRVYCWYHLAETLLAMGETEEALAAACAGLAAATRQPSEKQQANASMIYQMMARAQMQQGLDPLPLLSEGLAAVPHDHALSFIEARARLDVGDYERALQIAERLRAIDPESLADGLLAFDRRIFGEFAADIAGVAAFRLGRFATAAGHFAAAAAGSEAGQDEAYRMKAQAALLSGERAQIGGA
ncbi:MAG TPA: glycosyltransferase family 2 protein [Xanthobacteraceae bacterium]|nr:glycosyltransferase family 2 protein [Xanthobacteraceae bacterium]